MQRSSIRGLQHTPGDYYKLSTANRKSRRTPHSVGRKFNYVSSMSLSQGVLTDRRTRYKWQARTEETWWVSDASDASDARGPDSRPRCGECWGVGDHDGVRRAPRPPLAVVDMGCPELPRSLLVSEGASLNGHRRGVRCGVGAPCASTQVFGGNAKTIIVKIQHAH